jgi:hypothetical protein
MESLGFVERDPQTGLYGLGLALVTLAGVALNQLDVRRQAVGELAAVASELGLAANLAILRNDQSARSTWTTTRIGSPRASSKWPTPFHIVWDWSPSHRPPRSTEAIHSTRCGWPGSRNFYFKRGHDIATQHFGFTV